MSNLKKLNLLFYLWRRAGLEPMTELHKVKEKFKLESFKDIKTYQLDVVIDQLKDNEEM